MTESRDVVAELSYRIQADIDHFGGTMPEMTAVAWRGYLAAMLEWNLIPVATYDELLVFCLGWNLTGSRPTDPGRMTTGSLPAPKAIRLQYVSGWR